jgi:hypothetical protein
MEDNSFIDSSQNSHTVNVHDNTCVSNQTFKIGESSAYFDGSQDYLSINENNDWNFKDLNFTIDFWVKADSTNDNKFFTIFEDYDNQMHYGLCGSTNNVCGYIKVNGTIHDYGGYANNFSDNEWHHIAIVRKENNIKTFIDGFEKSKIDFKDNFFDGGKVYIGVYIIQADYEAYGEHIGYIDEFRISKGIARWFSDFNYDLPNAPYCDESNADKEVLGIVGDINNDGKIDLLETIYSLQVTAGIKPLAIGPYAMTWKGDWKTNDLYKIYDAVNFDGSSYICIVDHTSETAKPENINTNYWEILAKKGEDGQDGQDGQVGQDGQDGESAISIHHEWNGTSIRFQKTDGSWGDWVDLKGNAGEQGAVGSQGPQGATGPQGLTGPPVTTSAVCVNGEVNAGICSTYYKHCSCSSRQISKVTGPCEVTSDTGSCSISYCGTCCVCGY